MNKEKLMKMASAVRTGGKGSVRRYVASGSLHFVCSFLASLSAAVFSFAGFCCSLMVG
jgi:hypothetical protein